MKVVIIGGNAAGMSAAARMKRKSPQTEVVVLEKSNEVSYGACGLPYYVAGVNPDLDLMRIRKAEEFCDAGIDLRLNQAVAKIQIDNKSVYMYSSDGVSYTESYDKLIVASGSSPVLPKVPGIDYDGVFALKTLQDAQMIRDRIDAGVKRAVIVGGGYIGLEIAEAFYLQGVGEIHLIEGKSHLLNGFDEKFGEAAKMELLKNGIQVHTGETLKEVLGNGGRVSSVVTDASEYQADIAVIAVGVRPNTAFIDGVEKLANGAIITDTAMRSSQPDIFAAGDCATTVHRILNKPAYLPLGTNANKQGRLCADSVIGKSVCYNKALGTAMLRCIGMEFAKTGLSEQEAKANNLEIGTVTINARSHARYYPEPKDITIKLCCEPISKVILGAQIMGEKEAAWRIDVFACAVDQGMTAEELGLLDLGYSPPFASVWDAIHIAANAIK